MQEGGELWGEDCVCRRHILRKFEETVKACEHWKSDSEDLGGRRALREGGMWKRIDDEIGCALPGRLLSGHKSRRFKA